MEPTEDPDTKEELSHHASFKNLKNNTRMDFSYVETYSTSNITDAATTQPSFKKLFITVPKHDKNSLKSILSTKSHAGYCPYRWSRNRSSSYLHQTPPLLQINAGKRVLQKYRKFARNLEYKRLHSIIPSLSKRKYASKARILHEAIKYIDSLHQQLITSIKTKGLPPILQKARADSDRSSAHNKASISTNKDTTTNTLDKSSKETKTKLESSSSSMSTKETISLIQTALQPEIEKRLESRRNMDRLAMEALLKFSHPPSSTNQIEQFSDTEKQDIQRSNPKS